MAPIILFLKIPSLLFTLPYSLLIDSRFNKYTYNPMMYTVGTEGEEMLAALTPFINYEPAAFNKRIFDNPIVPSLKEFIGRKDKRETFWNEVHKFGGVSIGTEKHALYLKATMVNNEKVFLLSNPKKDYYQTLNEAQFEKYLKKHPSLTLDI